MWGRKLRDDEKAVTDKALSGNGVYPKFHWIQWNQQIVKKSKKVYKMYYLSGDKYTSITTSG